MRKLKHIPNTDQRKKLPASLDKRDNKIFKDESKCLNINFNPGELLEPSKFISGLNNDPVSKNKFPLSWEFIS